MTDTTAIMVEPALTPAPERIIGLDVTRGFAVMGILAMNIIAFAMPENAYITPVSWGGTAPADIAEWAIAFLFFDSKMRGLFSILFGASTLLVIQSAIAAGRSAERTHYGRMVTLALFGLAHFYLIWDGDILFLYAICGLFLFLFRGFSVSALAVSGWALVALNWLLMMGPLIMLRVAAATGQGKMVEVMAHLSESFAHGSAESVADVTLYSGSYAHILGDKVSNSLFDPLTEVISYGTETLGLMLIGMALYKSGMLRGEWPLDRLDRWRNRCLAIGLLAALALLALQIGSGMDPWVMLTTVLGWSAPTNIVMSIGYAALFMGLAQRFGESALIARVAAAGRAAFSNYLGTSIVMTSIFYGYGLGLYGEISRAALVPFVIGAWVIMLLWSKPWLDRFRYGPMEWLWRSMARAQMQPMRRAA